MLNKDLPIAGYYRFSKSDQIKNPDTERSHLFQIEKAIRYLGGEPDPNWIFRDIMSGRRKDRPGFLKLKAAILNKQVWAVVARVDRLNRNVELSVELSRILEATGVQLFDILKGRVIDFSNPSDWADYQRDGVGYEKESRDISSRIKMRNEFMRAEGKIHNGKVPFGYKRSPEGKHEPDPSKWETALEVIRICRENDWRMAISSKQILRDLGVEFTYQGLTQWLKNEVLRGNTPYLYKDRDKCPKHKREPSFILYGTHPRLIDEETARQIDLAFSRIKQRGKGGRVNTIALSGLVFCGRCGAPCHILPQLGRAPEGFAIWCSKYRKGWHCGESIKKGRMNAGSRSVKTAYLDAENAVIIALTSRAEAIASMGTTIIPSAIETPEIVNLRQQIERYEKLAKDDPDMIPVLAKKRTALTELVEAQGVKTDGLKYSREKLASLGSDPTFWAIMPAEEKVVLFREFVERVDCDRSTINVTLRV